MLETLLSYGEDAKKTQLTSALYYKDAAGQIDTIVLTAGDDGIGQEVAAHKSKSRSGHDGALTCRHFLLGLLHVERSQRQDKVGT